MPKRVWAWKFRGLLDLPEEGPRIINAGLELEIHDVPSRVKERALASSLTHDRGMHDRCHNNEGEPRCDTDILELFHGFCAFCLMLLLTVSPFSMRRHRTPPFIINVFRTDRG